MAIVEQISIDGRLSGKAVTLQGAVACLIMSKTNSDSAHT